MSQYLVKVVSSNLDSKQIEVNNKKNSMRVYLIQKYNKVDRIHLLKLMIWVCLINHRIDSRIRVRDQIQSNLYRGDHLQVKLKN